MRPPSALGIPGIYLPPVQPLPGGNQYGGFPVNPFPQPPPKAPVLAQGIIAPVTGKVPASSQVSMGVVNPVFAKTNTVADKPAKQYVFPSSLDYYDTSRTLVKPQDLPGKGVNQPGPVNQPGTNYGDTNKGADILIAQPVSQTSDPAYPVSTPSTAPVLGSFLGPLAGANYTNTTSGADILQRISTAPAPAPSSGGGTPMIGVGGVHPVSDISKKENIVPLEPVWSHGIDRSARKNPLVGSPTSVAESKDPVFMAGLKLGQSLAGSNQQASSLAGSNQQASFEGAPNPMMGQGLPQQAQTTVNIPFGQVTPNDLRDQTNQGFVSSPVEAKKDIRPVDMMIAPQDYQDAWKGTSMEQSAAPPQQFPVYSMSSPPIIPGKPAVDLRPAQGYSYEYKEPNAPGAKPGRQYGPMAQDLEKTPAGASVVEMDPNTGMKRVDTNRLTMVNTAAISEQQRKMDALLALLDWANEKAGKDTGPRAK